MADKTSNLDLFYIKSPCTADWHTMQGGNRVRFCGECKKYVYNLSAMSRAEAEAFLASSNGNLCARLTQRADGTPVTLEPSASRASRPSPIAAAVVSAIMSLSPAVAAQQRADSGAAISRTATTGKQKQEAQPQGATLTLSGKVTNAEKKSALAGATVTLMNENTGATKTVFAAEDGVFRFASLKAGSYIFKVEFQGFDSYEQHGITLKANETRRLDVQLRPHLVILGGGGIPNFPLRELYENSDRIVVATVGESTKIKEEKSYTEVKIALDVSLTVKGEGHKPHVYVHDSLYEKEDSQLKLGDHVLLFLNRSESGRGEKDLYDIKGYDSGIKKLSEAELQSYLSHVEDLKKIEEEEKPDQAAIVEWLVQCVEDPVTRWEGALELSAHANEWRYRKEQEETVKAAMEQGATSQQMLKPSQKSEEIQKDTKDVEDEKADVIDLEKYKLLPMINANKSNAKEESNIITLLTEQQKERLMSVLLNTKEMGNGEWDLLEVVKDWNDVRLMPFLITNLRAIELAPTPAAMGFIQTITELLNDEEVSAMAQNYLENAPYEDLQEEEEEEQQPDTREKESVETERADGSSHPKRTPLEAVQQRSTMLKEFLKLVEKKLAKEEQ